MQEFEVSRIRSTGKSVCLYRLRRAEVNGPRCLFRAALRKAKRILFTPDFPVSSMQRIRHASSRRASSRNHAGSVHARRDAVIFDDLRAIQLRCGFLPKAELEGLSQRTQTPLYQIHSVASFYPHFHLVPPPKAEIRVCADMSCHLNGACELRADLESRFANARPEDVQIRDVSCLGRCDHAPPVSVNDHIFTNVTSAEAEQTGRSAIRGEIIREPHPETSRVACKSDPYGETAHYGVVRALAQTKAWNEVLDLLKSAELRGMGGAGFPTSMKWDIVRKQADPVKYIICNADESEPGTIKDRFIMTHLPYLLIEGMMVAAFVTGAKRGIIYIRHEYSLQEEILGEEIRNCYQDNILGKKILGSGLDFDLEIL